MSGTFINYREDDAKPWALLLRDELVDAFGEAHVFLDKDTLHAGSWREQIQLALDRCEGILPPKVFRTVSIKLSCSWMYFLSQRAMKEGATRS